MHPSFVKGKPGLQIIPAGKGRFHVVDGDGAKVTAERLTRDEAEAIVAKDDAERAPAIDTTIATEAAAGFVRSLPRFAPVSGQPLLSICIPTRNRADMLRTCLAELAPVLCLLPFPVEVVISDNCSDDATAEVAAAPYGAQLRYFRQPQTLDVVDNYCAVMRHARGKYAHYLADDDALEPEGLIAAVEWMEREPEMAACFHPQKNVADGTDALLDLENDLLEKPAILKRGDFASLTDIIGAKMWHPEVPLVRSEVWRRHVTAPRKMFFGFWIVACLLEAGDVGIGTRPFYLHRQRPLTAKSPQVQYEFAVDRMDQHRLGLEMLYLRALRSQAQPSLTPEQRAKLAEKITTRMAVYAQIAGRISFQGGDRQAGAEFFARAALWGSSPLDEYERETLDSRIGEEIARRAASTDGHLQVVETEALRQKLIAAGAAPETVVAREDIARALQVAPFKEREAAAA